MLTNFRFNNGGTANTDFDDVFIRRDIFTTGNLWEWGNNGFGQLGDNSIISKSSPVQAGSLTNWKQVGASSYRTIAIKSDGTLWQWGTGAGTTRSSPTQLGALTNWYQISVGGSQNGAIKTDGTLWLWGSFNDSGQMGNNTTDQLLYSSPIQVGLLANWKQVSCGGTNSFSPNLTHITAIKTDGTLWTWGHGGSGALGLGDAVSRSSPTQVGTLTNWKQVSAGSQSGAGITGAIKTDGTLWTWGYNDLGQLGLGDIIHRSSPVQVGADTNWKQVSAGYFYMVATKTNGTLWAWGENGTGKLGVGNIVHRSSPTQVGAGTFWKSVDAGDGFTAAIRNDGTAWTWGQNTDGQLGNNSTTWTSSPIQVISATNYYWKDISAGVSHAAGIIEA